MKGQPLILLAFANQQDNYLAHLKLESKQIEEAFAHATDQGTIRLWRSEHADSLHLLQAFNRFDAQIVIFHYGGHAQSNALELEDRQGHSEGLAQLLSRQSQLRLVFLNGCSTRALVEQLLALGIPAVIGTSAAIDDRKASEFATYFYDKLASKGTIEQAFYFARSSLQLRYKRSADLGVYPIASDRGITLEAQLSVDNNLPWGLYYNKKHPEVLQWTLPLPTIKLAPRSQLEISYEINEYLYPILDAMATHDVRIQERKKIMEDEREYFEMIIKHFPWDIGAQFGLLVAEREVGIKRLEQIISTYMACGQWLYFVPLSQLWKERTEKKLQEFKNKAEAFFTIWEDNFLHYDYLRAFQGVLRELKDGKIPLFVDELEGLGADLEKGGELYAVYLFLESIRAQLLLQQLPEGELPALCADAEFALAQILTKLSFLVSYRMVTVRDIIVSNPRHMAPRYFHRIGRLNAHTDERLFFFKHPKSYDNFLENDSVLLLRDTDGLPEYLSLSPFFIDRNAYRNKEADLTDLYTYGYARQTGEKTTSFHYLKSSRNLLTAFQNRLDQLSTSEVVISDIRQRGKFGLKNRPGKQLEQHPYAMLQEQFDHLIETLK